MADVDGLTERYSEKWLEYVGQWQQQQQELWLEALHRDDRQAANDQWKQGTSRAQPFDIVGRLRRADGEYRLHLIAVSPALDGQGSPRRWFGCCTDLEAQQQHRAMADPVSVDAWQLGAPQREILRKISHDLRTPLQAILGWVSLLKGGGLEQAKRAHALLAIERNAKAQSELIQTFLDAVPDQPRQD